MGNVAGEQGLALQQHFPYKFPYSFKTSDCHKISSFNGGGLKFDHFDIPEILFFISGICNAIAHNFMKSRSRDGLAAKGLFYLKFIALRDNIKAGADLVRTITSCKTFGNLALS